jgi:Icc-related predicted phosphoesterase
MAETTKLFFATDIHGSDTCLRKFVNAAKFYGCSVLLMGGDITGKMIIPIVDDGSAVYRCRLFGVDEAVSADALPALHKRIADAGYYAYETEPDEMRELAADPARVDELFTRVMTATLEKWMTLAEERLAGTDTIVMFAPGNDDPTFVDEVLRQSDRIVNPEGDKVELAGGVELVSVGYANPTPWSSPRELEESELLKRITTQAERLDDPSKAIFNLHVPPKETPLDQAMLLDEQWRPILRSGRAVVGGVGSSAVRTVIESFQPMLSLHGHIHESRGGVRIGRTVAINPGSEYSEGVLRGAIVTLHSKKGLRGFQLVAG